MAFDKKRILDFIIGKSSSEEYDALKQWQQDSHDNIEQLRKYADVEDDVSTLSNYQEVDTNSAWKHIEESISDQKTQTIGLNYRRIAAVFALFALCLWGIQYMVSTEEKTATHTKHIVYSGDKNQVVNYKDGSEITLGKDATLKENDFRSFGLSGNAYFKVARDENNQFRIIIYHGEVYVLGTEFSINSTPAYSRVVVTKGRVRMSTNDQNYILNDGDVIEVRKEGVSVKKFENITPENWKHKELVFQNSSIHDVLERVALYYSIELIWQDGSATDHCRINTTFKNQTLESVLKELTILTGMEYEIQNNQRIIIKSYKC